MFYAVAHHGTAGLNASYSYTEVLDARDWAMPRSSMTMTVVGPFATRQEAQREANVMQGELDLARARLDEPSSV